MVQSSPLYPSLLLLSLFAFAGCGDEKCDDDQVKEGNGCVAAHGGGGGQANGTGGVGGVGGVGGQASGTGGGGSGAPAPFGDACADNTGCGDPAALCAIQPGMSQGYCTAEGCVADPSVCPSGWSCFDLTQFGGPNFCAKP